MAYSELIKNFDKIRSYMRDFFLYGFRTRDEFDKKSIRSYDNERRRIQSYLGDLVSVRQTASGRNVFISLEGRRITHNPLYKAFKSKSFTDKDITLHFILMDIFISGESYTLNELIQIIGDEYLSAFDNPISFDESTLRKKLKEYEKMGLVISEKSVKTVKYSLVNNNIEPGQYKEAIRFFTEENPLGVVGSYIEDRIGGDEEILSFKNHYIMNAYDTEILEAVLKGIHEKRQIEIVNFSTHTKNETIWNVIPLKLYVSTQGGRNYLQCMDGKNRALLSFRIDCIQKVILKEEVLEYDSLQEEFKNTAKHMWGVNHSNGGKLEHIEMDIHVGRDEEFIIRRLEREKRCGEIIKLDDETYRFAADVYDSYEMVPWIRTFIGRISALRCDNEKVCNQLKTDCYKMARQYEVLQ